MAINLVCPSCGYKIMPKSRSPQIVVCPSCQMTSIVSNAGLNGIFKSVALTDIPSIFSLYNTYEYRDWRFVPIGRVRYDYGQGSWDEFYVREPNGKETWVSVDEGDIAAEILVQKNIDLPPFEELAVGQRLKIGKKTMVVTELNSCTMIGAEGELPFAITPEDTYKYADLLGPQRTSFTIEYEKDGSVTCYRGSWIDPFEIKRN